MVWEQCPFLVSSVGKIITLNNFLSFSFAFFYSWVFYFHFLVSHSSKILFIDIMNIWRQWCHPPSCFN
uniref:Uncharacterized protein n=1 Tax=Rhizophora mucronata TaxID=61149 RepID=A0A2P2R0N3_RHIMU